MNKMNKKGIALVIAIIVLLGLSLMATAVMLTTQSEMKIGAAHKWYVKAMDVAQAGINEVIHRMKLPDTDANWIGDPNATPDPDWEAVVLNTSSLPADVGDTTFVSDAQIGSGIGAGETLYYTTSEDGANALKIHYKHKGGQIYFYDQKHQREILGDPGLADVYEPIIVIEVTGRYAKAKRKIITEVTKYSIAINVPAGLAASAVSLSMLISVLSQRDVRVEGHVNNSDTPWWTVPATENPGDVYANGGTTPEGKTVHWTYETNAAGDTELYHARRLDDSFHPKRNMEYDDECGGVGCIPGIVTPSMSTGGLVSFLSNNQVHVYGNPDILLDPDFTTPEIWEILGFSTKAAMMQEVHWDTVTNLAGLYSSSSDADSHDPQFIFVNKNNTTLKKYGRGVLWIKKDAQAPNTTFGWKGIVYIEGNLTLKGSGWSGNSNSWVLGTLAVKGDVQAGGGFLSGVRFYAIYCPTVINTLTESAVGRFIILNWREIK